MKIPKSEEEIIDFVSKEHENTLNLYKELNQNFLEQISNNISQRRIFYQNLATLSGIILGFVPFFFEEGKIQQPALIFFSIIFLLSVIILIVNYLRALMDCEGDQLKKQLDGYNEVLNLQMEKRRKFLENGVYTEQAFRDFLSGMVSDSKISIDKIKNDSEKNKESKKIQMDYAGEFFILFFVLGISLILISFTGLKFSLLEWILLTGLLFLIIFFVPFHKIFIYSGYPIDYVKNKLKSFKSWMDCRML